MCRFDNVISVAHETVDHKVLLNRLQYQAGSVGDALNWMESYLENKCFLMALDQVK